MELSTKYQNFSPGIISSATLIGISTQKKTLLAVLQSKIGRKLGILALAGIGLKLSHFGQGCGYKTCLKRFKSVIIGISTPKNPMLAVLQSKSGHKLGILAAWAGIGLKLSHFGHENVPKTIQKCHNRHLRPQKPHVSRITKQNRPRFARNRKIDSQRK